ncbi:MAG: hypothetical protein EZS28_014981 [Streblomastix strix]|uniref:Uncharacterized protein n=1 Tax=Streblomastix strix TaxID=222440 RepID=A0A5J4W444_9EUKA|nr:MAG: hypothetical protein EZS28_014981 [Streblomastix strix]
MLCVSVNSSFNNNNIVKPNALIGHRNLKVRIQLDLNFESPLQVTIESVKKIFSFWSQDKGKKENTPETENEDENNYNEQFTFAADVQGLTVGVLDSYITSFFTHKCIVHFISIGVRYFQEEEGERGKVLGAGQLAKCDAELRRYIQVLDVIRDDSKSSTDDIGAGKKSDDEKLKDETMKRTKDEKKASDDDDISSCSSSQERNQRATFAGIVPALKHKNIVKKNKYENLIVQQIKSNKPLYLYVLGESAKDNVDDIHAPSAHLITKATKIPAFLGSNSSYHPRSIPFIHDVQSLKTHLFIILNNLDKNLNNNESFIRTQLVFSDSAEHDQLVKQILTLEHKVFDSEKIEIVSILTNNERQFKIDNI